jgi:fluoride ion exporter CrcB/FEX
MAAPRAWSKHKGDWANMQLRTFVFHDVVSTAEITDTKLNATDDGLTCNYGRSFSTTSYQLQKLLTRNRMLQMMGWHATTEARFPRRRINCRNYWHEIECYRWWVGMQLRTFVFHDVVSTAEITDTKSNATDDGLACNYGRSFSTTSYQLQKLLTRNRKLQIMGLACNYGRSFSTTSYQLQKLLTRNRMLQIMGLALCSVSTEFESWHRQRLSLLWFNLSFLMTCHYATNRKVVGSSPDEVINLFFPFT